MAVEPEIAPAPDPKSEPRQPKLPAQPTRRPAGLDPQVRHRVVTVNPFAPAEKEAKPKRSKGRRRSEDPSTIEMRFPGRNKESLLLRPTLSVDERVIVFHKVRDDRSEHFRVLRSNLVALSPRPHRIMITSSSPNEGKSFVVANLAAAFAEKEGPRVLIVDANLRHPEIAHFFSARSAPGVSEFLQGAVSDVSSLILPTGIPGVDVLPSGEIPQNPGALWVYHALRTMLASVPSQYDYILVDTPSVGDYADASVMAPDADGVLMVVRIAATAKSQTQQALDILESSQARVLGAFATNAR
jgi:capsular exopolysaccharide synthesis family protein